MSLVFYGIWKSPQTEPDILDHILSGVTFGLWQFDPNKWDPQVSDSLGVISITRLAARSMNRVGAVEHSALLLRP